MSLTSELEESEQRAGKVGVVEILVVSRSQLGPHSEAFSLKNKDIH